MKKLLCIFAIVILSGCSSTTDEKTKEKDYTNLAVIATENYMEVINKHIYKENGPQATKLLAKCGKQKPYRFDFMTLHHMSQFYPVYFEKCYNALIEYRQHDARFNKKGSQEQIAFEHFAVYGNEQIKHAFFNAKLSK